MTKLKQLIDNIQSFANGRYELAGEYQGYNKPLALRCRTHDRLFHLKSADRLYFMKNNSIFEGCPDCKSEKYHKNDVTVSCAYCGKVLHRKIGWNSGNATDLAFCCREHKVLSQRVGGQLVPKHYGKYESIVSEGSTIQVELHSYRKAAFCAYPRRCEVCGYHEFEKILQVHHVDGDRTNNSISNLVILCPTCHALITCGLFEFNRSSETKLVKSTTGHVKKKKLNTQLKTPSRDHIIHCLEDDVNFSSYASAGRYYQVSDTTIRHAVISESNYCKSLNKHFQLLYNLQV